METYQGFLNKTGANLYRSRKVHLPKPELYVIFVGNRVNRPAELSLSREFFGGEDCAIEVKVRVIYGSLSQDEKGKDDIIGQYIAFSKIYDQQRGLYGRTQEAIKETIRVCVERDILREYLRNCEKEVTSIMSFLFDDETIRRNALREERWEARRDSARRMLLKGKYSIEEIADVQDLTVEEVLEVKEELQQEEKAPEIIDICREQGLSDEKIIEKLQERLGVSLDRAEELFCGKQSVW